MTSIRHSLYLTFLSSNGATVIQFLTSVVLARLLTPQDIGIYSITAVLIAIAHFFRDFGVVGYLQQAKDLTREDVAAAFGVLLTASWCIAGLTYLAAPFAANFYGEPGVAEVMRVLALGYIFIPFGAVTHSLLTRDYRAKEQAYVQVISTLTYAGCVIFFAWSGMNYMSMAWANLVNIIVTAMAYLPFRPALSTWRPRFTGWRRVVNFGAGATLGNSLGAVNNALPDIVLGKLSGPHDVGVMSRAMSTTQLLNQVFGPTIGYAVLPYFSKAHHSGQQLAQLLSKSNSYITGLMWPALACTAIYSKPLILTLYGTQWIECVPVMQVICLMFMLGTPFHFLNSAFMAIGRPYLGTFATVAVLALRAACIWGIYDGSLLSFAWALVLAACAMYPVQVFLQMVFFSLQPLDFLRSQSRSLGVAAICCTTGFGMYHVSLSWPHAISLLAAGLVVPATWLAALWVTGHPLKAEIELGLQKYPKVAERLRILTKT
jgi:O-antigen/teichoic acid export membrane protein